MRKSTCEPWRTVSFVYLLWLFEMFLALSRCLTLGETDLRTIKDVPNWLCKELVWPVAALEMSSTGEQKGIQSDERLRPIFPQRQGRVSVAPLRREGVHLKSSPKEDQVCFLLNSILDSMSFLGSLPFCLKKHILNLHSWRPKRGPPWEFKPVQPFVQASLCFKLMWRGKDWLNGYLELA